MADHLLPELTVEMIDAFFSPFDHEMPHIELIKCTTLGVNGMGGYTYDVDQQRAVYAVHGQGDQFVPPYKRHTPDAPQNREYAEQLKLRDDEAFKRSSRDGPDEGSSGGSVRGLSSRLDTMTLSSGSVRSGDGAGSARQHPKGAVFQKNRDPAEFYSQDCFKKKHQYPGNLPIVDHREAIVNAVESNSIVLIKGNTGSGKTTQVPQFILDDATEKRRPVNIVVTQPRKIAAVSIAERVCKEREWELGSVCGYQVGMDRKASDDTCILYCTSGVLLQKIVNDKTLNEYTHIVLDEIHERDADLDFVLLVVKRLQRTVSGQVKIILMSATMDSQIFSDYFTQYMAGDLHPCPVLNVEGQMHEVSEWYVDQLESLAYNDKKIDFADIASPSLDDACCHVAARLVVQFEDMEKKELLAKRRNAEMQLKYGPRKFEGDSSLDETPLADEHDRFRGSVLVFLPGLAEINRFHDILFETVGESNMLVIPLHSSVTLSQEKHRQIFTRPPKGKRKVILSTNIAESSITVPDVKYVIDFCLTKNLWCDSDTSYPSLRLEWASKSSCKQRRGRAGRVNAGRCYRMVHRRFYDQLEPHAPPEMQRAPLQQLVLKAKLLDMGNPADMLGLALSPPNLDDIERTILCLKEVGALINAPVKEDERPSFNPRFDGVLTFVGRVMAQLPLDVHLTKLILLGHTFGVLNDAIIMAASLNLGGFFSRPFRKDIQAFMSQLAWVDDTNSDVIGLLNAFRKWQEWVDRGALRSRKAKVEFGNDYFIDPKRIGEVELLVEELKKRLEKFNIVDTCENSVALGEYKSEDERTDRLETLHKIMIAGAFYPNYFLRVAKEERDSLKELSGLNPFSTVLLSGVPPDEGPLYKDQINAVFEQHAPSHQCERKFHFEGTKVFVEFVPPPGLRQRGKIAPHVYLALKMSKIQVPFQFDTLSKDEANMKLERFKALQEEAAEREKRLRSNRVLSSRENAHDLGGHTEEEGGRYRNFPSVLTSQMEVALTSVVSLDHFYAVDAVEYNKKKTAAAGNAANAQAPPNADEKENDTFILLNNVVKSLNHKHHPPPVLSKDDVTGLKIGDFVAAKTKFPLISEVEEEYHRGRVTEVRFDKVDDESGRRHVVHKARVFFVDCGISKEFEVTELRQLEHRIIHQCAFQAYEIRLANVRPNIGKYPNGQWNATSVENLSKAILRRTATIDIYSIVDNVIRCKDVVVDTSDNSEDSMKVSVVRQLTNHDLAEYAEEPMASRMNHEARARESDSRRFGNLAGADEKKNGAEGGDEKEKAEKEKEKKEKEKKEKEKRKVQGLNLRREKDWQVYTPTTNERQQHQRGGGRRNFRPTFRLHGPMNPLVMSFRTLNSTSTFKSCAIVQDSVNSICLDEHPGNMHDQLLVAATVGMHTSGNRVVPRNTTLMPMVPGLAHVVPLIFAPQAEFRTNERQTHFTGVLLGLGFNKAVKYRDVKIEQGPVFPDHDMEMTFDTEITTKDVMSINNLRGQISAVMMGGDGDRLTRTKHDTEGMQFAIRQRLFKILDERRKSLRLSEEELKAGRGLVKERVHDYRKPNQWNQTATSELIVPYDGHIMPCQNDGPMLPFLSCFWTGIDQVSESSGSNADADTVTSSDGDTESVASSSNVDDEEPTESYPRGGGNLETGSLSGLSVHSSEYAEWRSDSSARSFNMKQFVQLDDFRKHEAELRRRGTEGDEGAYPCQLCGEDLVNIRAIRDHLRSPVHCQRVDKMRQYFLQIDNC